MAVFRALTAQYTFKTNQRRSTISSDMMGSSCVMRENKYVQTFLTMTDEEPEALKRTIENGLETGVTRLQKNRTAAGKQKGSKDVESKHLETFLTRTIEEPGALKRTFNDFGTAVDGVLRNETIAACKQKGSTNVDKIVDKSVFLKRRSHGNPCSNAVSASALNSLFEYPRDGVIPMHLIYAGGRQRKGSVIEMGTRSLIGYESAQHERDSSCQNVDLNGHVKCPQNTESNRIRNHVSSSRTNNEFQSRVICCECKGVLESYV